MSSYRRFEDTPAWRLSQDYAYAVFEVTREACFKFRGDLVNQLRRAEHAREVARADAPTRMSASEFNRIAEERGVEAAAKERNARMAAWIDSFASRDERLAAQAQAKGRRSARSAGRR